jgi:hypothetical protein
MEILFMKHKFYYESLVTDEQEEISSQSHKSTR